jgi:hypothetical protein
MHTFGDLVPLFIATSAHPTPKKKKKKKGKMYIEERSRDNK